MIILGSIGLGLALKALAVALGGVAIGGVTTVAIKNAEQKKEMRGATRSARAEGSKATRAEYEKKLKDYYKQEKNMLNLYAIGMCVSDCDGELAPIEEKELQEFLEGEMGTLKHLNSEHGILTETQQKIKTIKAKVLSGKIIFQNVAESLLKQSSLKQKNKLVESIDNVIKVVIKADNKTIAQERALLKAWKLLKKKYV